MIASPGRGRPGTAGPTPLDYGAWRASLLGRVTEELERDAVLELVGPVAGREVLDVGCGDGTYALALAARGARATGVDASARALEAASARARRVGLRVRLVAGDAGRLPVAGSAFDLVVAVTALCFAAAPERAFAEMARVLRPGGRMVVGELGRLSAWAAWRRLRGWAGSPAWRRARFWTPGALRRLAREAGLVPGRVRGAAFHPPLGVLAAALAPTDPVAGRLTTVGAAFVAVEAVKPPRPPAA